MTQLSEEYIPKIAMTIHAHPDDQEFSVGGTIAKWAKAGCEIISVVITSGDSGSNDPSKGGEYKPELARLREKEQLAANKVLGIKETVFMRYPDGELEPTIQLRKELTRFIRKYKPDAVVSGNPEAWFYGNEYLNHADHRAASRAACEAVFPSAGSRLIFADLLTEGFEPHDVRRLFIHGVEKPDTWVDISATLDVKVKALQKHTSQVPVDEVEKWLQDWAKEDAKDQSFEYAESFRVMKLSEEKPEQ
ncbi:PIG-L family deacetylase [Chloroflexota bacterium]